MAGGNRAVAGRAYVRDASEVHSKDEETIGWFGRLDIIVSIAAIDDHRC
jgi:hypothetical protein